MAELFRIETDRLSFAWSPATDHVFPTRPVGTLRILPRDAGFHASKGTHRAGVPAALAPDASQISGPPLYEETSYSLLVSAKKDDAIELRHRDPNLLRDLQPAQGGRVIHGRVNFRSQVGLSRFTVLVAGRPYFDLELEVFPSKISYRDDYARIMADVQDLAAGLALEYLRATYRLGEIGSGEATSRLDWLALLRHVLSELERALRQVQRRPNRGLTRHRQSVRAGALRRSDSQLRKAVRTGQGRGERLLLQNGTPIHRRLPEQKPRPTLNTPEHQWLAQALKQVRRRLVSIIDEERDRDRSYLGSAGPSDREERALNELLEMEQRVARLEAIEPLKAATGLPPAGFTSLQLQGSPGYREALRALTVLRRGLTISGGPVELSVKDLHLLYEYWCFLGIVKLVAKILETPIPADQLLEIHSDGLHVRLQKGRRQTVEFALPGDRSLEVTYNPTFHDADVLLPQQPDFVLTLSDPEWPTIRLVLDAKYRVESSEAFVSRFGAPGPPSDAVNVLHRYRDAILESTSTDEADWTSRSHHKRSVIEGAALFPLSAEGAESFGATRFWSSLDRMGIGALPFLPGSSSWVEEWLRGVLKRSGWAAADAVVPHAAEQRHSHWRRESEAVVLVGVLRGGRESEHLSWTEEHNLYYTPLTPSQARQMRAEEVAFYLPARARDRDDLGAVTHAAAVHGINVMPRRSINTPWPARKGGEELQVVYQLGALRELPREIVNRVEGGRGQRFSSNRWTSGLALARATTLSQLMLDSLDEWELHDGLKARGIPFRITADRVRDQNAPGGRAWFSVGSLRIRYRGGGRYELSRNGKSRRTSLTETLQRSAEAAKTQQPAGASSGGD